MIDKIPSTKYIDGKISNKMYGSTHPKDVILNKYLNYLF